MAKAKSKAKKKWMQGAAARMKRKGTVGAFTRWCKAQGYGGVTSECIRAGLKSSNPTIRKRAGFAKAAKSVARKRKE
jgi:hypothetical protein